MACITKRRGRWVIDFYDQFGVRRWKTLKAAKWRGSKAILSTTPTTCRPQMGQLLRASTATGSPLEMSTVSRFFGKTLTLYLSWVMLWLWTMLSIKRGVQQARASGSWANSLVDDSPAISEARRESFLKIVPCKDPA